MGHSINYHAIEELETKLTYTLLVEQRITPYGMYMDPTLCSGVALDNFDCYMETSSSKNTLHDTVGIAYQDLLPTTDQDMHIPQIDKARIAHRRRQRKEDLMKLSEQKME